MEEIIRLRGHHILCLLGFRGLGYSPEFVENMTRVHSKVFSSNCKIEIVAGADDICGACPRLTEQTDETRNCRNVKRKDESVLAYLSLKPGDSIGSTELYAKLARSISTDEFNKMCHKCKWVSLGYCLEGLQQLSSTSID